MQCDIGDFVWGVLEKVLLNLNIRELKRSSKHNSVEQCFSELFGPRFGILGRAFDAIRAFVAPLDSFYGSV